MTGTTVVSGVVLLLLILVLCWRLQVGLGAVDEQPDPPKAEDAPEE